MSRYSSNADVFVAHFSEMPAEYHEAAADYVDNLHVKAGGEDPTTLFDTDDVSVPWLLKKIALYRAMELYAQASQMRADDSDFWANQERVWRNERKAHEMRFDSSMLRRDTDVDYLSPDSGGASIRKWRV